MENLPFPRLLALLDYWREWPPFHELMRGYVGYKPLSKDELAQRNQVASQEARRVFKDPVAYNQLPKWLRDAHAQQNQIATSAKPPKSG